MAKVIAGKHLQELIGNNTLLCNGVVSNCDGIKYDFRLDDTILKSKYGVPINYSTFPVEKQGTELVVSPGEMVFVMSKETLNLPKNVYSQLSPRRKMTEFGIITLGGLAIDPGYNGKLLFGLYNVSSEDFKLVPNAKLAGAVFYELEDEELLTDYIPPEAIDTYSSTLIEKIKKYEPIGLKTLEDSVREMEKQLDAFKRTLIRNSDTIIELDELVHKTTRNIERISIDIENLKESLKLESEARKDSLRLEEEARKEALKLEEEARKKISSEVNKKVLRLQGALWLATAIISGVATVVIGVLTGLIKF
jgi:deoxycytidine triphosphate deaminase